MLSDLKIRMDAKELEVVEIKVPLEGNEWKPTCDLRTFCDCDNPETYCEFYCELNNCKRREHLLHSIFNEEDLADYEANFRVDCEDVPYFNDQSITRTFRCYLSGVVAAG